MEPQCIQRPNKTELRITQKAPALEFLRAIDKEGLPDVWSGTMLMELNKQYSQIHMGKTQHGHIRLRKSPEIWVFAEWPVKIYAKDSDYWEKKQDKDAGLAQGEYVKVSCYLKRWMTTHMWETLNAIKYAKTEERILKWIPNCDGRVDEQPTPIWFRPSIDIQQILSDAESISRTITLIYRTFDDANEKTQASAVLRKLQEAYTLMRAFSAFEEKLELADEDTKRVLHKPKIPKEFSPEIKSVRKSWERLKAQLNKLIDSLDPQIREALDFTDLL
jgi:hypothetical protein